MALNSMASVITVTAKIDFTIRVKLSFQKYNVISKRILRLNHNEIFTNYIMTMIYMCRMGVDLGARFSCFGQYS